MIIKDFQGYKEGEDITKIPQTNLAYPSKNCLVHKGKVYTRLGISLLGAEGTTDIAVHSEEVWKDSKCGYELPMRGTGAKLQVYLEKLKTGAGWVDLLTLATAPTRMEFATWTDSNTSIVKKRMFMVHGTGDIVQWNGAVAIIDSISGNDVIIKGTDTAEQLGFDDGSTTQQTVIINGTEYTYSGTVASTTITLDSPPTGADGDLIIVKPLTHTTTLASFNKDFVFNYKNHLVLANLTSNELYFSNVVTYSMATGLDFTLPAPASRTAVSPMYFTLSGNVTALYERKNILWASVVDDWYKIEKLYEINGYDEWATVEKVESAKRMGALPFAVSGYKGDMIFIAQDSTVQTVSDLEIIQSDQIKLVSDDIEDLLLRLDLTESRIYHNGRYIYITVPQESTLLMLDVVEGYWQPPQILPMSRFSIIDGQKVGHSDNTDQSFLLFNGNDDLGADIESIIALGYLGYLNSTDELELKAWSIIGFSGRMTESTTATVAIEYETDGAKAEGSIIIDGSKIKMFDISDDASLGKHPFATRSWAGGDIVTTDLKRFFVFSGEEAVSFFEWRPIITVTGKEQEFQLLAMSTDLRESDRTRANDLFISK
jgi:hypothetical protein